MLREWAVLAEPAVQLFERGRVLIDHRVGFVDQVPLCATSVNGAHVIDPFGKLRADQAVSIGAATSARSIARASSASVATT